MTGVSLDGRGGCFPRYGDLVFHAENPVHTVRKRTVRWALLVVVAVVVTAVVMTWLLRTMAPGGVPPWWIYPPLLAAWFVLLWSVPELLGLILAWRQVGWSVDVYEQGVVESRFGAVRQAMPFAGGVIDPSRALFASPHPDEGPGLLTAPWKGELIQVPSEIRAAAQPILVRETLARLSRGDRVDFPGTHDPKPGITLTSDRMRVPNGHEFEIARMRIQYSKSNSDNAGYVVVDDPCRADGFHILTDEIEKGFHTQGGHGVPGLQRPSPNLAVVRETLHVLVDPDGHRVMYRAQQQEGE